MKNTKKINAKKWYLLTLMGMLSYGSITHAAEAPDETNTNKSAETIYKDYVKHIKYGTIKFDSDEYMKEFLAGMVVLKDSLSKELLKYISKGNVRKMKIKDKKTGEEYKFVVVSAYKILAVCAAKSKKSPTKLKKRGDAAMQDLDTLLTQKRLARKDIRTLFNVMISHFGSVGPNNGFIAKIIDNPEMKTNFKELMGPGFTKILKGGIYKFRREYTDTENKEKLISEKEAVKRHKAKIELEPHANRFVRNTHALNVTKFLGFDGEYVDQVDDEITKIIQKDKITDEADMLNLESNEEGVLLGNGTLLPFTVLLGSAGALGVYAASGGKKQNKQNGGNKRKIRAQVSSK